MLAVPKGKVTLYIDYICFVLKF